MDKSTAKSLVTAIRRSFEVLSEDYRIYTSGSSIFLFEKPPSSDEDVAVEDFLGTAFVISLED